MMRLQKNIKLRGSSLKPDLTATRSGSPLIQLKVDLQNLVFLLTGCPYNEVGLKSILKTRLVFECFAPKTCWYSGIPDKPDFPKNQENLALTKLNEAAVKQCSTVQSMPCVPDMIFT